jgi:hypothetical protein
LGVLEVGDIITFTKKEKLYKKQAISIVTKIVNDFVYSEGNVKSAHITDVKLICKAKDRKDN